MDSWWLCSCCDCTTTPFKPQDKLIKSELQLDLTVYVLLQSRRNIPNFPTAQLDVTLVGDLNPAT